MKKGELRLIPKETFVWSIANQSYIKFKDDIIGEITSTCVDSNLIFLRPKFLFIATSGTYNMGTDELAINYKKTEPFETPKTKIFIRRENT